MALPKSLIERGKLGTDKVDDDTAIGVTARGSMEECFSVRERYSLRIDVGETDKISGIAEADDRFVTRTRWF